MKANELRIGNLVTINNIQCWDMLKNIPVIVTGMNETPALEKGGWTYSISLKQIEKKVNTYFTTIHQFIQFIEPILLTEEWLIKLGFEIGSDMFEEHTEYEKIVKPGVSITLSHEFECYQGIYSQKIQYVHQLQNLYFVLTGEELEIKS